MGRPLRIEYPGAFYHVTSRGNERRAIFLTQKDYERMIGYLESATERYGKRGSRNHLITFLGQLSGVFTLLERGGVID